MCSIGRIIQYTVAYLCVWMDFDCSTIPWSTTSDGPYKKGSYNIIRYNFWKYKLPMVQFAHISTWKLYTINIWCNPSWSRWMLQAPLPCATHNQAPASVNLHPDLRVIERSSLPHGEPQAMALRCGAGAEQQIGRVSRSSLARWALEKEERRCYALTMMRHLIKVREVICMSTSRVVWISTCHRKL
jgi:hypothetical protein